MGKNMEILLKIKNKTAIWSSYFICGRVSEGSKIGISKRYLHSHVHCSIIHSSLTNGQVEWTNEMWYIWKYNEKNYSTIEKEILLKLPSVTIRGTCNTVGWVKQARHRKTNTAWYNLYVKPHMHREVKLIIAE